MEGAFTRKGKRKDFKPPTFIPDLDLSFFWTNSLATEKKAYIFSGVSGRIYSYDRKKKANVICQSTWEG